MVFRFARPHIRSCIVHVVLIPGKDGTIMKDASFSKHNDHGKVEQDIGLPSQEGPEQQKFSGRTIAFTLAGTMLVTFIATLDQTVVGAALPRIIADLQGFELITWITTVYLLTSTVTIPMYSSSARS